MKTTQISKRTALYAARLSIPGDKSLSHRSIMFGALAKGTTEVTNFLKGADCLSTIVVSGNWEFRWKNLLIPSWFTEKGLHGLLPPSDILDTGNSGTTTRLISGILAGQNFTSILSGDDSLNSRPMGRLWNLSA